MALAVVFGLVNMVLRPLLTILTCPLVVLTLGLEARPAARDGWFVEAGVGGGARLAAGYRWRRFSSPVP